MEKTIVKAGAFKVIENTNRRSGYKTAEVVCKLDGKKVLVTITESWKCSDTDKGANLTGWKFISGDAVVDAVAKSFPDFATFTEITGDTVNTDDILFDADVFFGELKAEANKKEEAQNKINRAKAYDSSYFIITLKPALEAKGHKVTVNVTKEEFIASSFKDVTLTVGNNITVSHDWHGWLEARNNKGSGDLGVSKTTKSTKLPKHIETIEWVIDADKQRSARKKEELKNISSFKDKLAGILGEEVVEKKEYHSSYNGHGSNGGAGYETTYFQIADETSKISGMRFVESYYYDSKAQAQVPTIQISCLPRFKDGGKLKKLIDLLKS